VLCDPAAQQPQGPVRRKAGHLERLTRASLAAYAVAIAGGYVTQQYIEAPWLQYFAPAVLGVVCAAAAVAGADNPRRSRLGQQVRVVASLFALAGVAWGVELEGTFRATTTDAAVLLPYVIAAAAAWAWAAPPRPRKRPAAGP